MSSYTPLSNGNGFAVLDEKLHDGREGKVLMDRRTELLREVIPGVADPAAHVAPLPEEFGFSDLERVGCHEFDCQFRVAWMEIDSETRRPTGLAGGSEWVSASESEHGADVVPDGLPEIPSTVPDRVYVVEKRIVVRCIDPEHGLFYELEAPTPQDAVGPLGGWVHDVPASQAMEVSGLISS